MTLPNSPLMKNTLDDKRLNEPSAQAKGSSRSTLVSRNVTISGHRTSVRLEPEMWSGLSEICRREGASLHEVCSAVAAHKTDNTSLTAAIRVFVVVYFRAAATEDGHAKASHGRGLRATAPQSSPNLVVVNTPAAATQTPPPAQTTPPFMMGMGYMGRPR